MDPDHTSFDNHIENPKTFLDALEHPTLLMQTEPRQVVTANEKACELFGKTLAQIEGHRGGQVFDCIYAFTEAGCGVDINCENCKIKNAVVHTFSTGISHNCVDTILDIKKHNETTPYDIEVSTEKFGDFTLICVLRYKMISQ